MLETSLQLQPRKPVAMVVTVCSADPSGYPEHFRSCFQSPDALIPEHGRQLHRQAERAWVGSSLLQPGQLLRCAALRTVPVAARVVRDAQRAATVTFIGVPAQSCYPALRDVPHRLPLLGVQPMAAPIGFAKLAKHIGHFDRWQSEPT